MLLNLPKFLLRDILFYFLLDAEYVSCLESCKQIWYYVTEEEKLTRKRNYCGAKILDLSFCNENMKCVFKKFNPGRLTTDIIALVLGDSVFDNALFVSHLITEFRKKNPIFPVDVYQSSFPENLDQNDEGKLFKSCNIILSNQYNQTWKSLLQNSEQKWVVFRDDSWCMLDKKQEITCNNQMHHLIVNKHHYGKGSILCLQFLPQAFDINFVNGYVQYLFIKHVSEIRRRRIYKIIQWLLQSFGGMQNFEKIFYKLCQHGSTMVIDLTQKLNDSATPIMLTDIIYWYH